MAFKNARVSIAITDTTIYTCPLGEEAVIHSLIIDNNSAVDDTVTVKVLDSSGATTNSIMSSVLVAQGSPFTPTTKINLTSADALICISANGTCSAFISSFETTASTTNAYTQQGAWSNAASYNPFDLVDNLGSSYAAINANSNDQPPSVNWQLIAEKGAVGGGTVTNVATSGLAGGGPITDTGTVDVPVASQVEAEAGVVSNKAMTPQRTKEAIAALVSGSSGLKSVQVFEASGTWTKPAGVTMIRVQLCGGGAGGGNSGKCGGAGGYSEKTIDVTAISSETVTIGAGGTGAGAGGTSSFGAHLSATGGLAPSGAKGSYGGVGSGGDINIYGGGGSSSDIDAGGGGVQGAASYFGGGSVGYSTTSGGADYTNLAFGAAGGSVGNGYTASYGKAGVVIVHEYGG